MINPFLHLEKSAKSHPERVAISTVDADLTFAELLDSSVRIAKLLRDRGVTRGDTVGTHLPPIMDLVISEALFHEACIGAQIPADHPELVADVFDWLIVDTAVAWFPPDRQIVVDDEFMANSSLVVAVPNPLKYESVHSLCRLSFTSGTTGVPKAIPVSIDCMEDRALDRTSQWMPSRPYLCLLGLSTGLTFMSFYFHVFAGETFILAGQGPEVLDQIDRHGVTCLMASPFQLGVLLEDARHDERGFDTVATVMSAGSVLPDAIVTGLAERFDATILATYASTEAGSVAIRHGVGSINGLAGTLLPDVDVKIVGENFETLEDGSIGLVAIKRARQPQEYLDNSAATSEFFRDGYFLPGDLGYLDGRDLYLAGRASEVFNAAGVKVDPARVEAVAREFEGITDAAVFGFTPANGLQEICMFYTSRNPIDQASLATLMHRRLHETAPSKYVRVPSIARNHMGKVNRTQLAEQFASIVVKSAKSEPQR